MFDVLGLMRTKGLSFRQACVASHTDSRTARKYAGRALTKTSSGKVRVSRSDRLTRRMQFLSPSGPYALSVRGSKAASELARYWIAVDWYLATGDDSKLTAFEGKRMRSGKESFPYLTDRHALKKLGNANQVTFEDLYARAA